MQAGDETGGGGGEGEGDGFLNAWDPDHGMEREKRRSGEGNKLRG